MPIGDGEPMIAVRPVCNVPRVGHRCAYGKGCCSLGKSKVVLPKKLISDPAKMAKVIQNTLNEQALAVKIDFEVTVQTWGDPASFTVVAPSPFVREIGTGDSIYSMLNAGTKPHAILPKRGKTLRFRGPFQAKTVPNSISSGPGSVGTTEMYRRGVQHPGTEARNWDTVIAKKWRRLFARQMQRAIDAAAH